MAVERRGARLLRRDRRLGRAVARRRGAPLLARRRRTRRCSRSRRATRTARCRCCPARSSLYLSDAPLDASLDGRRALSRSPLGPLARRRAVSVETSIVVPTLDDAAHPGRDDRAAQPADGRDRRRRRGAGRRRRQPRRHARARRRARRPLSRCCTCACWSRTAARAASARCAARDGLRRPGRFCVDRHARRARPARADPEDAGRAALGRSPGALLALRAMPPRSDPACRARFRAYQSLYRRAIRVLLGYDMPDSTYGFRAFQPNLRAGARADGRTLRRLLRRSPSR